MSVLIREMKMPNNCLDCPFDFPVCDLWDEMGIMVGVERHPNFPLEEVCVADKRVLELDEYERYLIDEWIPENLYTKKE